MQTFLELIQAGLDPQKELPRIQSNLLKWIALGPHRECPQRQNIHLSMFHTLHCVWMGPDKWYPFKRVIHLSSIRLERFEHTWILLKEYSFQQTTVGNSRHWLQSGKNHLPNCIPSLSTRCLLKEEMLQVLSLLFEADSLMPLSLLTIILLYETVRQQIRFCSLAKQLSDKWLCYHTVHTYTHLTALCLGLPGSAGTRKIKPIWILLKEEAVSGSGISWAVCKSAPLSRQITTPAPHHSVFYRPDALPAA